MIENKSNKTMIKDSKEKSYLHTNNVLKLSDTLRTFTAEKNSIKKELQINKEKNKNSI